MDHISRLEYKKLVAKKLKYGNKWTQTSRGIFQSKLEADYEKQLFLSLKAKEIKDYACQVTFTFSINDILITKYMADFVVRHLDDSMEIIETKGFMTSIASLKMKMLRAQYGRSYKITVVKK